MSKENKICPKILEELHRKWVQRRSTCYASRQKLNGGERNRTEGPVLGYRQVVLVGLRWCSGLWYQKLLKDLSESGYLHPGISVSSLKGGTVSNVLAYFLAACLCACRASISFLVLGIRHLKMQQRVITERGTKTMAYVSIAQNKSNTMCMALSVTLLLQFTSGFWDTKRFLPKMPFTLDNTQTSLLTTSAFQRNRPNVNCWQPLAWIIYKNKDIACGRDVAVDSFQL